MYAIKEGMMKRKQIIKEIVWNHLMDAVSRMSDEFALSMGEDIAEDILKELNVTLKPE